VALLSRVFLMFALVAFMLAGVHRFLYPIEGVTARGLLVGAEGLALLSIACGVVQIFELVGQKAPRA